jgi:hypothetical protein
MTEPIVCPLWATKDKRFRSRHYHAWDRPCGACGRKVVVSDAVKRRLDSSRGAVILCEQCAVIQAGNAELQASSESGPDAAEDLAACVTCAALKEQVESAAMELARCKDLPDTIGATTAYKKWAHVFRARWDHRFKAHNNEPRGRE